MKKGTQVISQTQVETGNLDFVLSDATGTAEAALNVALDFCAEKMALDGPTAVIERLQQGDRHAYGYFNYGLAKQAAEWLGSWDEDIKAVYVYEYEATPEDSALGQMSSLLVNMIVWAKRKTGALQSMLDALNRALVQSFAQMIGNQDLAHMLDVRVVDDEDMKHNIGCVAMFTSIHTRPIRVWER